MASDRAFAVNPGSPTILLKDTRVLDAAYHQAQEVLRLARTGRVPEEDPTIEVLVEGRPCSARVTVARSITGTEFVTLWIALNTQTQLAVGLIREQLGLECYWRLGPGAQVLPLTRAREKEFTGAPPSEQFGLLGY